MEGFSLRRFIGRFFGVKPDDPFYAIITINGEQIRQIRFNDLEWEKVSLNVAKHKDTGFVLGITINRTFNPAREMESNDTRELGCQMRSLMI